MSGAGQTPVIDAEEAARARRQRIHGIAKWTLPVVVMVAAIGAWWAFVVIREIPHYILPGPDRVFLQIFRDAAVFASAGWVTLKITLFALLFAVLGGVGLSVLFSQSKWAAMSFFP